MEQLKIFLCDLTYDTVTLSTEAFPLNIGYIASYAKMLFNEDVKITLFKYIEKLEDALETSLPDIIGFSNYSWNRQISKELSKIFLEKNPNGLVVWGGPNLPPDYPSQIKFFKKFPEIDIYVPIEGEIGFSNIVEKALTAQSKNTLREKVLNDSIPGCITKLNSGKLEFASFDNRIKALDDIPSPYLTGILDEFFDGKLAPMIQTNRGCPFSCTFCVDGSDDVNQVNQFTTKRVDDELNYISNNIQKTTHSLLISDLNFGMYSKDIEICTSIQKIQNKFGYPNFVKVTSGKNRPDKISLAIKKLGETTSMTLSVQSLNEQVLSNIKRQNISSEKLIALAPTIKQQGLGTVSEIILGLPGETYETHIQTIRDIIRANIDEVYIYTLMLLDGSELNTPKERQKWNFNTKFRILPRDFVKLKNGKIVLEIEEVAIGTNTLSFDEYVELRLLALLILITQRTPSYQALFKFLKLYDLETFDLVYAMLKNTDLSSQNIQKFFNQFKQATIDELWDTEEELKKHYQDPNEYNKLLNGTVGQNLLFFFHASAISEHIYDYTDFVLKVAKYLITKKTDKNIDKEFLTISNYCIGSCHNIFGDDRMETNPEFDYDYDILAWMNSKEVSFLNSFELDKKLKIIFELTEDQYKTVEDSLDIFGHNKIGRSQVIKVVGQNKLWRKPVIIKQV